jgi:CubicO group peptidase (beta-lactamase class C family)
VAGAKVWSYTNVGWCLLGRVIETATDSRWPDAMRRHLASAGLRETTFATDAGSKRRATGHEITAEGPVPVEPLVARAYGPAGTTAVSSVPDLLRFAALHLEDSSLAALREVHAEVCISGSLDSWCLGWAWFDIGGGGVWGWDSVVNGERAVLRIVPEHQAAAVLMTNASTGRAAYRSLFGGVYAWPDRRVEVTPAGSCLRIKSADGVAEAPPLDERTFLVDAADPDNPTVTFGAYDAAGRPQVLYLMLWGLPRLDE